MFTSFSFDPAFFEDHVLRAILRLPSDPVEQAERYHSEARRALQETPVVAVVDAGERRPGRRLPFDLLEVSDVVFHPKSVLLLYRGFARLLIGSGNLTSSGYGGNSELFVCTDLSYETPQDAALLIAFDEHLGRVHSIVRRKGTQFAIFREELRRKLPRSPTTPLPPAGLALLDSTARPIIEQIFSLLPSDASVTSVGMLAPFYEKDDAQELDSISIFRAFDSRIAADATLDIGVSWENPQVQPTPPAELKDGLGRIWTWARHDDDQAALEHFIPASLAQNTVFYLDEAGQRRRTSIDHLHEAIETRAIWMQPDPVAFAPRQAIAAASERFSKVRLWLHPATQLLDGRPSHRPLHAKLLVVSYRAGQSNGTLVVVGSPNMSRRAMLMQSGPGQGNVEVAVAFLLEGSFSLRDFVPQLLNAPASAFALQERQFPEQGPNYALAIEEATHDPRARTLSVDWSAQAGELPPWSLTYAERQLAASGAAPTDSIEVDDFTLNPSTAEVVLHVGGREYPSPILVTDLVELPVTFSGATVGLDELLLLLGRRIGTERAVQIANRRAKGEPESDELNALFGEGFAPTDVFRAWWCAAEDLQDPDCSLLAFRLRLEGALGIGAAWSCMLDAQKRKALSAEEVWFYGAELLRSLAEVMLPALDDLEAKSLLLSAFRHRVRTSIEAIELDAGSRSWTLLVRRFYEEAMA